MEIFQKIILSLSAPYPLEDSMLKKIFTSLGIGAFIFLFLIFFQPFELYRNDNPLSFTAWISMIGILISLFHMLFIQIFFNASRWNIIKELCWDMWIIITVGTGIFLLYIYRLNLSFSWALLIKIETWTLVTTFLPVIVLIFFEYNRYLQKNLQKSLKINQELLNRLPVKVISRPVVIKAENPQNNKEFDILKLIYISSADNYVIIHYEDEDQIHRTMIRTTIKKTQSDLAEFDQFYRTHKQYIINLKKIRSVSGNAQGLKVKLKNIDEDIPVSRRLLKEFSSILKQFT